MSSETLRPEREGPRTTDRGGGAGGRGSERRVRRRVGTGRRGRWSARTRRTPREAAAMNASSSRDGYSRSGRPWMNETNQIGRASSGRVVTLLEQRTRPRRRRGRGSRGRASGVGGASSRGFASRVSPRGPVARELDRLAAVRVEHQHGDARAPPRGRGPARVPSWKVRTRAASERARAPPARDGPGRARRGTRIRARLGGVRGGRVVRARRDECGARASSGRLRGSVPRAEFSREKRLRRDPRGPRSRNGRPRGDRS